MSNVHCKYRKIKPKSYISQLKFLKRLIKVVLLSTVAPSRWTDAAGKGRQILPSGLEIHPKYAGLKFTPLDREGVIGFQDHIPKQVQP